jgi:hypothetical protein
MRILHPDGTTTPVESVPFEVPAHCELQQLVRVPPCHFVFVHNNGDHTNEICYPAFERWETVWWHPSKSVTVTRFMP